MGLSFMIKPELKKGINIYIDDNVLVDLRVDSTKEGDEYIVKIRRFNLDGVLENPRAYLLGSNMLVYKLKK